MINIIDDSLKYYDDYKDKRNKFIDLFKNKRIEFEFKTPYNSLPANFKVYDENNNLLYNFSYQIIGFYIEEIKIWLWGWGQILCRDTDIKISYDLFKFGRTLDHEINPIKKKLISTRVEIENINEIKTFLALISFNTKNPYIYKFDGKEHGKIYIQFNIDSLKKYNLI